MRKFFNCKLPFDLDLGLVGWGEFFDWCNKILWSWNSEQVRSIPRSQSTSEYSESPRNGQLRFWIAHSHDVTRTTHTNLDVLQESRVDEYWNVNVDRNLSDSWTGFTMFTLLSEKSSKGHMWSREATYTHSSNSQTGLFVSWKLVRHVESSSEKKGGAGMGFWKSKARNMLESWQAFLS